jgi:hypothetical protein
MDEDRRMSTSDKRTAKKAWVAFMVLSTVCLFATFIALVVWHSRRNQAPPAPPPEVLDPLMQTLQDAYAAGTDFELRIQDAEAALQGRPDDISAVDGSMRRVQSELDAWLVRLETAIEEFNRKHPGKKSKLDDVRTAMTKQKLRVRMVLKQVN